MALAQGHWSKEEQRDLGSYKTTRITRADVKGEEEREIERERESTRAFHF